MSVNSRVYREIFDAPRYLSVMDVQSVDNPNVWISWISSQRYHKKKAGGRVNSRGMMLQRENAIEAFQIIIRVSKMILIVDNRH